MKVFDLFSKRHKRLRGEVADVYQYKTVPYALRVQIVHIWRDAFGDQDGYRRGGQKVFKFIHQALCREYGQFNLGSQHDSDFDAVARFLLQTDDTEKVIDAIEMSFQVLDRVVRGKEYEYENIRVSADDAIAELNYRLREHGVGYQYESGQIVRVDSQLIHSEVVRPALRFLAEDHLRGANDEFLSAHEHYRSRKYKECLNDCLKAFESTMKAICEKRRWTFSPNDTAKQLIEIIFANKLVPAFMQAHFTALRSTLESEVPTVRNRLAGHGQGSQESTVPESIASYALHLTAANIMLLAKVDSEMK
jgi:hypothetical protein